MVGQPPPFGAMLVRTLLTLAIPQGYTLSISGSFAVAVHRYGFPNDQEAFAFVGGAVIAFVVVAIASARSHAQPLPDLPGGFRMLFNVVPLVVVGGIVVLVSAIGSPGLGFSAAGFAGAAGYVLLIGGFVWIVAASRATAERAPERVN
jgi:hypothetical protein